VGKTDYLFKPGKLTFVMDGQFGSSGKGKISSYIGENADDWTFACNAFSAQAGHWVRLDDGREYFYQHLNSVAYLTDKYEKLYIGAGSVIELPALLREIEVNKVPPEKLGIDPKAMILDESIDAGFERGVIGFDGIPLMDGRKHRGTASRGSTCHGCGSALARKVLRRSSVLTADRCLYLADYICDVPTEIIRRLKRGESGLLEIAQGFPLSLNGRFFPFTTSRNVTTSQALSDMFIPPKYAGTVVINLRTLPIRINSKKYISEDGRHLTWEEVQNGVPHTVFEGNSGPWYPDQKELTWEEVTKNSGSPDPIVEMTSVTKLPRRIATFSRENVEEAIRFNDAGKGVVLSLNFANYIDHNMSRRRGGIESLTRRFFEWYRENLGDLSKMVDFIGTGALTEDMIDIDRSSLGLIDYVTSEW